MDGLNRRKVDEGHDTDIVDLVCALKAKFHYAIWSQTGPKLVADLSQTC